jgi:aminopeptidase N
VFEPAISGIRKILICFSFFALLACGSCSTIRHPSGTPIPEVPLAQMTPQPPHGVAGEASIGDSYIPTLGNTGYDVQAYFIDMAFSSSIDAITATVTLTSSVTINDLGRVSLDFAGYQVDAVQVDNHYAAFYRSPDKLYVDLPQAYKKAATLALNVSYHGPVAPMQSQYSPGLDLGLRTIPVNDLTYAFGEPDGAHDWFPCNDHPRDKATYGFKLTVPGGFTGVANGTLVNQSAAGDKQVFFWDEKYPMASYLVTVLVGKYQRIDAPAVGDVIIRHYVIEGDFDLSGELGETQKMLEYYSGMIGPYPFDEFGFIAIRTLENEPNFAEETQTIVMVDRGYLLSQQAVGVLAHELAHHWFGDAVSLANWNEVWLKEGLATYLMVMWLDHEGYVSMDELMSNLEDVLVAHASEFGYPMNQPPNDAMYGPSTYDKGAWVYHMLRQQIGDDNFTQFLREYYRRFSGGIATTADVQSLAQEVSGMDLSSFFDEWVYGSGLPSLTLTWVEQPGGALLQVCQAFGAQVYTLPLEVALKAADASSTIELISVDQLQEQVTYSTPFTVSGIVADPGQKVLADISVSEVDSLTGCNP